MLGFPAVPAHRHDLRAVRLTDSSWGGAWPHDFLPQSKFTVSHRKQRRLLTLARADCGDCGRNFPAEFASRGRVLANHVLQTFRRKRVETKVQKIPIYFCKDGQHMQYAWDGQSLRAISVEQIVDDGRSMRQPHFYRLGMRRIGRALHRTFVPEKVRPQYISYMRWKFMHRVLSSVLQVQCTQAMLQAIGIGARRALPAAAGLNWVLKDGLGRLGRLAYSGTLGSTFDSNLKRVRFSTSLLFSLSLGLEMLTPYFPSYFLILATVANVGRSIALAAYLATSSAIHKSFAMGDNLADVAAKGQVQTVVADNLGLALSCALSTLVRSNKRFEPLLLLVIYPLLTGLDLFSIYHELQAVHLQTLNKVKISLSRREMIIYHFGCLSRQLHLLFMVFQARLEIIVDYWLRKKTVPTTEEVSEIEGSQFFQLPGQETFPLRIGSLNPAGWQPDDILNGFHSQAKQPYAVFQEHRGPTLFHQAGLVLWLKDDFTPKDVITGVLHVGYLRGIVSSENYTCLFHKPEDEVRKVDNLIDLQICRQESTDRRGNSRKANEGWLVLVEGSRQRAEAGADGLLTAMEKNGWQTKHVLLAPEERHTYSTNVTGEV